MNGFWTTFVATAVIACVAFAGFGLALAFPLFWGRKAKRRCACAASREAMRIVQERERAAIDAKRYRPETVDLRDLPQISVELAEFAQRVPPKREDSTVAIKRNDSNVANVSARTSERLRHANAADAAQ